MILILKYFRIFTLILIAVAIGCGNNSETTGEKKEQHEDEHSEGTEVALSEEQIKLAGIEIGKYEPQNITGYLKVNGEIIINPDQESRVGSIIPGRVGKIYVKEGSYVRAGQTLAIIENLDLINAQVEYLEAKHEYEHSKTEYERQEKLASDNIGSKKELAKLKANYEHTVVGLKSAEQRLLSYKISKSNLENYEDITSTNELQRYYPITSPISGNIVSRKVTVGQYIEPSTDMFHIVNTSTVYVDLNIFEKDLQFISEGQKVVIETPAYPDEVYNGTVKFVNKIFDDANRTAKVRVSIQNAEQNLLPSMFVTAKIYFNESSVTAVPVSAIETEGDKKFIFVKESDEHQSGEEHSHAEESEHKDEEKIHNDSGKVHFKKVFVNTGISDDKYIQIFPFHEIEEGEAVVSKGTFYLKSELKKEELGEHEH